MRTDPTLARKYAQGLAGALADEAEYAAVRVDLESFLYTLRENPDLSKAVASPFVPPAARAAILDDVLSRSGLREKTVRLLRLMQEHGRLELLPEVAALLPEIWGERWGIETYEVSSVVALTADEQARLRRTLEARAGGPVRLVFRIDPGLIGGLAVARGHIVYDASLRGGLENLRKRIEEGP